MIRFRKLNFHYKQEKCARIRGGTMARAVIPSFFIFWIERGVEHGKSS